MSDIGRVVYENVLRACERAKARSHAYETAADGWRQRAERAEAEVERLRVELAEERITVHKFQQEVGVDLLGLHENCGPDEIAEAVKSRINVHLSDIDAANMIANLSIEVERLRPRRIETVEELDALPIAAVIKEDWPETQGGPIWERWNSSTVCWVRLDSAEHQPGIMPNLPAIVLWSPEAK